MIKQWMFLLCCMVSFSSHADDDMNTDWDHWYLGINLGPVFQNTIIQANHYNFLPASLSYDVTVHPNSFFIGGQIGRMFRYNDILLAGLELNLESLNINYNYLFDYTSTSGVYRFDAFQVRNQFMGFLNLRLGFDIGWSYMPYLTVGPSLNRMYLSYNNELSNHYETWANKAGITAGAGLDYHWTDKINFRCEYLFNYMAGATTVLIPVVGAYTDPQGQANATNNASYVRFAFNMMF